MRNSSDQLLRGGKLLVCCSIGLAGIGLSANPMAAPIVEATDGLIVIEAESAAIDENWVLHGKDSEYAFVKGFSGSGCVQYNHGTEVSGPPTSPLTYRFKVLEGGDYKLMARGLEAPLETGEGDKANDCYVRLVGVPNYQGTFTKFVLLGDSYQWSWNVKLESSHHYFESPLYPLKPGVYQIQIAGRSKNFFLDRLVLRKVDGDEVAQDLGLEQKLFEEAKPGKDDYLFKAIEDFKPTSKEGYGEVYIDKGRKAIAVNAAKEELRKVWSAAEMKFTGNSGTYNITLKTLTETDGESPYRLFINEERIGNFTNSGTAIDYSPTYASFENVKIKRGDTIRVESKPATNGLIPEGDGTAWSRGRWVSVMLAPAELNQL